jgi:hypothetical protein
MQSCQSKLRPNCGLPLAPYATKQVHPHALSEDFCSVKLTPRRKAAEEMSEDVICVCDSPTVCANP